MMISTIFAQATSIGQADRIAALSTAGIIRHLSVRPSVCDALVMCIVAIRVVHGLKVAPSGSSHGTSYSLLETHLL